MNRIVVVDDEESIRNLCVEFFSREGYNMEAAASGDALFTLLRSDDPPDLILMDLRMPGETELSLLHTMPNQKDNRIPIIVYSGIITPEIELQAFQYGAVEVVPKGSNFRELRRKVKKVLGKKDIFDQIHACHESFSSLRKRKLMVVDDEEGVRTLLTDFFKEKHFEVVSAADGSQALELFKVEKPETVLLDLALTSEMSGMETLEKLLEMDPDVGIVAMTGAYSEEILQEAVDKGAYSYAKKPFTEDYLSKVVLTRLILSAKD